MTPAESARSVADMAALQTEVEMLRAKVAAVGELADRWTPGPNSRPLHVGCITCQLVGDLRAALATPPEDTRAAADRGTG